MMLSWPTCWTVSPQVGMLLHSWQISSFSLIHVVCLAKEQQIPIAQSFMKRKFKQWWSKIPLIPTKQTITSHINSLSTKKDHDQWRLEIWPDLELNRSTSNSQGPSMRTIVSNLSRSEHANHYIIYAVNIGEKITHKTYINGKCKDYLKIYDERLVPFLCIDLTKRIRCLRTDVDERYWVTFNALLKYNYFIMYLYNPPISSCNPFETKSMIYHNATEKVYENVTLKQIQQITESFDNEHSL
jgi:hypothetical protein